tara:strand:+ start:3964 stop:4095 length:132 start_codon:yes stop_codon:yes gene_type:complete
MGLKRTKGYLSSMTSNKTGNETTTTTTSLMDSLLKDEFFLRSG